MLAKTAGFISAAVVGALIFTGVAIPEATDGPIKFRPADLASYTAATISLDKCPTLSRGYHGGCVNQLQTELNAVEGANLSVDGTFGGATRAAVEVFQREKGISPADGIVGPQTKAALDGPVSKSVATLSPGAPNRGGSR